MDARSLIAIAALTLLPVTTAHAHECTPVLMCPYVPPIGGTGGTGGGGAGGTITPTSSLRLDKRVVRAGTTLRGSVTYGNTGKAPVTVRDIRIATRAPGASHEDGPYTDMAPTLTDVVIPPGESVTLGASREFTNADPRGQWEAYSTYLDAEGKWHDAPSEHFSLLRSFTPTPPTPTTGMSVGAQEWFIAPWAGTDIYKAGVNWATAYSSGADIWNPQFLAEIKGISVFRHMDTNAVNWSKIRSWSQRKLPTDPKNQEIYIDGNSSSDTTGMAVEWQIDLCNKANVNCWFTHPYLADDDYITRQAMLIKDKLNPQLKAYIELSNEVWNGSFSAFQQSIDAGAELGLPGGNQYYQGIAHEMYRALQMYQLYENVFGVSAMGSRVVRVFSESGNLDLTTAALKDVYESVQWNPDSQRIDMIALAPYIGNGQNGASETLSRWNGEVDSKVNGEPISTALNLHVKPYDIPMLGCYEAGMHHLENADAWARNPDSYDGYVYMLDRFATKMNGPCALYTAHGTWEPKGAWGLRSHVGQALAQAPKARAASEWLAGTATRATTWPTRIIVILVLGFVLMLVALWIYLARKP